MTAEQQERADLLGSISRVDDHTQFSRVIVRATLIEKILEILLDSRMTAISKKLREEIFEGKNAPLGTLSAKIDISCALGLITPEQRTTLNNIRKVRNAFAHADTFIYFGHETFESHKYVKGNPAGKSEQEFIRLMDDFVKEITPSLQTLQLVRAIKSRRK